MYLEGISDGKPRYVRDKVDGSEYQEGMRRAVMGRNGIGIDGISWCNTYVVLRIR